MPRSGANSKKAILNAADRIVQERGVERLTLEQIADEAGLSKGGLLYHFPNKEALIRGMIQNYLDRFAADLNQADEQKGPGRRTRAYLHVTYDDYNRTPRMTSGLLAAVATNPALLAPMQQDFEKWVQQLADDDIDPVVATIVRLAVDGLWLVELFGLAPPTPALREKVLRALEEMVDREVATEAQSA